MRSKFSISVLIPTRNERQNLKRCLSAIADWADEIVVIDSQSTDGTIEVAEQKGAKCLQFYYKGGWPKKRQWALDTYDFRNDWILLLDADEIMTEKLKREIETEIIGGKADGYHIPLTITFLGRRLRFGGYKFYKLSLFRKGKGHYEKRFGEQTKEMADMEVHEHVIVNGKTKYLNNAIEHRNVNPLYRYIQKHNEYSSWEAELLFRAKHGISTDTELPSKLTGGTQAQKRRWLKLRLFYLPGFSVFTFLYHYVLRLGFLDGYAGFYYAAFKGVQRIHTKAKLRELEIFRGKR